MKLTRITIISGNLGFDKISFVHLDKVDATTEEDILAQMAEDE